MSTLSVSRRTMRCSAWRIFRNRNVHKDQTGKAFLFLCKKNPLNCMFKGLFFVGYFSCFKNSLIWSTSASGSTCALPISVYHCSLLNGFHLR